MADMPRPLPPFLVREVTRHGRVVYYVRRGKGPRIRLHAAYGAAEFWTEYRAALDGVAAPKPGAGPLKAKSGTLAWLIERYRETAAWTRLSLATRRQRENIFRAIIDKSGHEPYARVTKAAIAAGRDRRAATPAQARHFLDAMRGLYRWAQSADHVAIDPTVGVANPSKPRSQGFPAWSEDDARAYEARWPIGTRERVWYAVLASTGLRRGDAVRLGRQHVRVEVGRDGGEREVWRIKTEKSQGEVTAMFRVLPALREALDAGPTGDLAFICGQRGEPLAKESFGTMFRAACAAAGVEKSAHGLRKLAAQRLAEAGASEAELDAVFGWRGGGMAAHYTRAANRERLAEQAMERLLQGECDAEEIAAKHQHRS